MNDPTKFFRVRGSREALYSLTSPEMTFGAQIHLNGLELIESDPDEDFTLDRMIGLGQCTDKGAVHLIQETDLEILQLKDLD